MQRGQQTPSGTERGEVGIEAAVGVLRDGSYPVEESKNEPSLSVITVALGLSGNFAPAPTVELRSECGVTNSRRKLKVWPVRPCYPVAESTPIGGCSMWQGNKLSASRPWFAGLAATVMGLAVGCSGDIGGMLDARPGGGNNTGGSAGAAGSQMPGTGGGSVGSDGGTTGGNGLPPCTGTSDPRLVVAPQRLVKLTRLQIINTIGALINTTIANQIAADPNFSDVSDETGFRSPPLVSHGEAATISGDPNSQPQLDLIAQTAAQYVHDNFATVTGCATATDNCATAWLTSKAPAIYRRPVTTAEQTRISGLYTKLKAQTVNGFNITATVEEATQYAVYGLLSAPEFLWRSEIGDATKASTSPPGIPLTDYELASLLSYFLTNGPPDTALLNDARAGTLRNNLGTQADR